MIIKESETTDYDTNISWIKVRKKRLPDLSFEIFLANRTRVESIRINHSTLERSRIGPSLTLRVGITVSSMQFMFIEILKKHLGKGEDGNLRILTRYGNCSRVPTRARNCENLALLKKISLEKNSGVGISCSL